MLKMRLSHKDAKLVLDTLAGRKVWPRPKPTPLSDEERAKLDAEYAKAAAEPDPRDAYGRWLASGNDFLSRLKRSLAEPKED
jgi:hypothetical protein